MISASEAEQRCDVALALIADQVTRQIDAITFDGIAVGSVAAKLYDVSVKHPIQQGNWTWSFPIGGGTVAVPATFAGDRIGP